MRQNPAIGSRIRYGIAAACCCLFSISCASDANTPPKQDPVLRVGVGAGPKERAQGIRVIAELLYAEPLIAHDWTGRPVGRLVDSWKWDDSGKTLTLKLRSGVKFHDGSLLTPEMVVRFLTKFKGENRIGFQHVGKVEAAPNGDVLVRLSQPDFFLLPELNELKLTHPDAPDVATGPFRLISRSPRVEVQRFEQYHAGRSALAGARIEPFDTQRAAWAALIRGEVDVVQEVSRDAADVLESSNIETFRSLQPFYIPLLFNHRHPALKHAEVRRAIVEAIDRTAIVEHALRNRGRIAHDPIWPFHWAYPNDTPAHDADVASAARRLDRAGFRIQGGGRTGEIKKRFAFKCLVYKEAQFESIALHLQRQLFDVGVAMEFELLDIGGIVARAETAQYDALLLPVASSRAMDYTYRMWRSGADGAVMLNSGYTGADELLDELRRSWTDAETRRILAALARRFHDDAPAAFIAWTEVTRAVSSRFDVGQDRVQDPFFSMWQWRPVEATAAR
jgi:peptide/nickel transport system substrate-binding protein